MDFGPFAGSRHSVPRAFAAVAEKPLLQFASKPVKQAQQVFALFLGWFVVVIYCTASHIVHEPMVPFVEPVDVMLAVACDSMPARRAIGVDEVISIVMLVLGRLHSSVVTSVVKSLHLGFGDCRFDCCCESVPIDAGGLQGAPDSSGVCNFTRVAA